MHSVKWSNSFIWPIGRTQSGATTPGESGLGSNGNEWVLHIPLNSPSDCLVTYYHIVIEGGLTPLQRCSRCILQPQPTGLHLCRRGWVNKYVHLLIASVFPSLVLTVCSILARNKFNLIRINICVGYWIILFLVYQMISVMNTLSIFLLCLLLNFLYGFPPPSRNIANNSWNIARKDIQAWVVVDRLMIIWKSDEIKQEFLLAVAVSVLQYRYTTWTLTKH